MVQDSPRIDIVKGRIRELEDIRIHLNYVTLQTKEIKTAFSLSNRNRIQVDRSDMGSLLCPIHDHCAHSTSNFEYFLIAITLIWKQSGKMAFLSMKSFSPTIKCFVYLIKELSASHLDSNEFSRFSLIERLAM